MRPIAVAVEVAVLGACNAQPERASAAPIEVALTLAGVPGGAPGVVTPGPVAPGAAPMSPWGQLIGESSKAPEVPPEPLKGEPAYEVGTSWCGEAVLGADRGDPFAYAVEVSPQFGAGGKAVLHFDLNNNEDLSDDAPMALSEEDSPSNAVIARSPAFGVGGGDGSGQTDRRYVFTLQWMPLEQRVYLSAPEHAEGKLRLGTREFEVRVVDRNHNGRFDDPLALVPGKAGFDGSCDAVGLDRDGDGAFGPDEWHSVGRYLYVEGQLYRLEIEPEGTKLTLSAPDDAMSLVTFSASEYAVHLAGENGDFRLNGAGAVRVPQGDYEIREAVFRRKDEQGNVWECRAIAPAGKGRVNLDRKSMEAPFGPPFGAEATAKPNKSMVEETYDISLRIVGRAGEEYGWSRMWNPVKRGGEAVEQHVVVRDGDGKERARFVPEVHGSDYSWDYRPWPVPAGTKRPMTVEPEVDLGPFAVAETKAARIGAK